MKVLFISSGKSGDGGMVVKNQGGSLKTAGIDITYFIITPGFFGYLKSITGIRRTFKLGNYDLAHAHYSLCGISAALAGCSPLVVSLMGSDIFFSKWQRLLIRFFYRYSWNFTIVKTKQMKELSGLTKAHIIPNGVDINRFLPIMKSDARRYLNYPPDKKIILFISEPGRSEKNQDLAERAVKAFNNIVEFKCVYNIPNAEIPYYLNAADVILLTSKWEGSANIVKEAMACNCPVVTTKVGDTDWLLGDEPGYYLSTYDVGDIIEKINRAFEYVDRHQKTNGRQRILRLGLDSVP